MDLQVGNGGKSECLPVMGRIGVEPGGWTVGAAERIHYPTRKRADFLTRSLITRECGCVASAGEPSEEGKQMTVVATLAGVPPYPAIDWPSIDWKKVNRTARRLQTRIVKAIKEGRWGKVKALQWLLTHSFSGKALAVKCKPSATT
jgi:hypothetical protein